MTRRSKPFRAEGESWHEISGNLPSDFGLPIAVHAHEPDTIYVVPIKSDLEHYPPEGKLRVYRSRTGGNEWEALTKGLPQKDCYVTKQRRSFIQFFACGEDLSHEPPESPLPEAVMTGAEPLWVVGAMAGG